jgi:Ca-activated chloride channel family protein
MTFAAPGRLLLLFAVAALALAYVVMQQRRSHYAVRFTNLDLLDKVAPTRPGWRRHVPAAAFLLMAVLMVTAFAKPADKVKVPRERATVIVAVDTSASMQATDVEPSRLSAAKDAAAVFVESLPAQFNVGLVSFTGSASVVIAPTTDRDVLKAGIEGLSTGPRTAIGEAVAVSLQAVAAVDARAATDPPPARIVLLSDGANTSGRSPEEAAEQASAAGVPVSTIAYGTADGRLELGGQSVPVPVDGPALRHLAETTGGSYYEAASGEELREVYEDIGSSVGYRTERQDVSARFAGLALLAALAAAATSLAWFSRIP